jgi:hypothetical protein
VTASTVTSTPGDQARPRADGRGRANVELRRARLRLLSPSGSSRPMSRQELADAVNAHVYQATGRRKVIDASYIGALERGKYRWPGVHYRHALRVVLGADSDAQLGLFIVRRNPADWAFLTNSHTE